MLLQDIFQNSKKILRLDNQTLSKITSDTHETANSLIVVALWSSSVLFFSFHISSSELIYPVFDHIFAWIIATFGSWYILSRGYKEIIQMQNLLALTGYAQILFLSIILFGRIESCFFPFVYCSSTTRISLWMLAVIFWIYLIINKGIQVGFYIDKKISSAASISFLLIMFFFSDILKSLF